MKIMMVIMLMKIMMVVVVMVPIVMLIANGFDVLDIRLRSEGLFVLIKYRRQYIWS